MNKEQAKLLVQMMMGASSFVGAWLIDKGVTPEQLTGLQDYVAYSIVALPGVISLLWSLRSRTKAALVNTVQAMPDVRAVALKPGAQPSLMKLAADADAAVIVTRK